MERLRELDLLRAAALIGMGAIHAGAWITPAEAPPTAGLMAAISGLARFCVPAFVFASGFALFHSNGSQPLEVGTFLRRRWARTLLPWAWCVPLFLAVDIQAGSVHLDAASVGQWLTYGPGHLYFLVLIAQLYVLFVGLAARPKWLPRVTATMVGVQLLLMAWRTYAPLPEGPWAWPAVYLSHEEAPFWAGTFALGCLAAARWPWLARLDRLWPLLMVGCVASAALLLGESRLIEPASLHEGNAAYLWPSRLPQTVMWCLGLLWLGRWIAPRLGRAWVWIGGLSRHSLGIYLLHPLFLELLGPRTSATPGWLRVPLLIGISFGGAYAMLWLLRVLTPATAALAEPAHGMLRTMSNRSRRTWRPRNLGTTTT